jgi:hypothetical protein
VTVDTRRVREKSKLVDAVEMEKVIQQNIQAVEAVSNITVTGIQIRGHHTRVLTSSEKDAALLRTHDEWVNRAFEGARTRGEDWHPIKIDDVVKSAVVEGNGHTVKADFAAKFYADNGLTGSRKHSGSPRATAQLVQWLYS